MLVGGFTVSELLILQGNYTVTSRSPEQQDSQAFTCEEEPQRSSVGAPIDLGLKSYVQGVGKKTQTYYQGQIGVTSPVK